jgi:glycosylphosphatidylinositol phospholipase D
LTRAVRDALSPRPACTISALAIGVALGYADVVVANPFPPVFPLAKLLPGHGGDGRAGFLLTGIDAGDRAGSVSEAGDVNGDGIGDVIVGAALADPRGIADGGECYVVFGRDTAWVGNFPAVTSFTSLFPEAGGDGSAGFVLTGLKREGHACSSVSSAGDVNGDGIDDLIIGAPNASRSDASPHSGESYVVFGRDTSRVGKFPAVLPVGSLFPDGGGDGSAGFVLSTAGSDADDFGVSVSAAGDVNGDGIDDLIVGAPSTTAYYYSRDSGKSYVIFGRDTSQTGNFPAVLPLGTLLPAWGGDGSEGFVLMGTIYNNKYQFSGRSVSAAGDVNGDGIDDLIVGAPFHSGYSYEHEGESYVIFGRDSTKMRHFPPVVQLDSIWGGDGNHGFVLLGIATFDYFGDSVSAAGDVNGDGVDDLIIGAPQESIDDLNFAGAGYVVFGRNTAQTGNFPAVIEMSTLFPDSGGDGSAGVVLSGYVAAVSAAGDVNGDGRDDVILGASSASPGGQSGAGASYVVFGRAASQSADAPR